MSALVRLPLHIVRTGATIGLELARLVERRVRGGDDDRPARSEPSTVPPVRTRPPDQPAAATPAPPPRTAREAAPEMPQPALGTVAPPEGPPQPEFADTHIDTDAEEVASFGPEEDAGAHVVVGAPWPDYDELGAQDVVSRVRGADDATRAAVLLYERQGRNRKTVVSAAGG